MITEYCREIIIGKPLYDFYYPLSYFPQGGKGSLLPLWGKSLPIVIGKLSGCKEVKNKWRAESNLDIKKENQREPVYQT
jgi:hypothetical protein